MTALPAHDVQIPEDKPPAWANSWMRWVLNAPVLQNMVGQGVALLSFTGRKTGKHYTVPVSYDRQADVVTVVTKRQRKWWHNFESPIEVKLRLAGQTYVGEAKIESDDVEALRFMTDYLKRRPIDAKAYGLGKHEVTQEKIARIIPYLVVIRIAVDPEKQSA